MTVITTPAGGQEIGEAVAGYLREVGIYTAITVKEPGVWAGAYFWAA